MSDDREVPLTVAVVVGGGPIRPPDRGFGAVIVADSGLDVALAAGLVPTMLVGDLDSISADGARWAADHGLPIEQHPADKDDTDTALALRCAAATRPRRGGRARRRHHDPARPPARER